MSKTNELEEMPTSGLSQAARGSLYSFLARVFLEEPDQSLLALMTREPMSSELARFGFEKISSEGLGDLRESLACDYCRIFIGPKNHVPPYQSVCQSGLLQGRSVGSMEEYLKYVNAPRVEGLMADHFGFQLQVMATILGSSAAVGSSAGVEEEGGARTVARERAIEELASSFFRDHLAWGASMIPRASQRATTGFYQAVFGLALGFLESEQAFFS